MTTTAGTSSGSSPLEPAPIVSRPYPADPVVSGSMFLQVLRTTDHKLIGRMYMVTSFAFFLLGGLMALVMRAELARPGMQFLTPEQYNQLFTMHGTIMLLFFATPLRVRVRQPGAAAADRLAGRRVPAAERLLLLAVPVRRDGGLPRLPHPGRRRRRRLDVLPAAQRHDATRPASAPTSGSWAWRCRVWAPSSAASTWSPRCSRLRAPGHDDVPDADLHLEHPGHLAAGAAGLPDPDRGAAGAVGGPAPGRAGVRRGERRRDPVAAPVLVLRPSRGLHPGAAVLRDRVRDLPGLQPQAAVRLQGPGAGDPVDRRACR